MEIAGAELARVRDLVLNLAPDAPEVDFLLWRWDLLNLKALLRREFGGPSLNRLGRYTPQEMPAGSTSGSPGTARVLHPGPSGRRGRLCQERRRPDA